MTYNPELLEFIRKTERSFFRTDMDTGANPNALLVWNQVRKFAGMDELTPLDLTENHLKTAEEDLIRAYAEGDEDGARRALKNVADLARCIAEGETMSKKIRRAEFVL